MAILHEASKEVSCKIVYHGAGRSGKTTSLMYLNHKLPEKRRGRFISLETPTERTLFFDFLPVLAEAGGYRFRFLLFATPGQQYYDASRRLVLKGADAIVFVVDSQRERAQENWEAYELLQKNLKDLGQSPEAIPLVIQYNKRDLANILPVADAERRFNARHTVSFPAVARTGQGVYDTFLTAAKMSLTRLSQTGNEERMNPLFRTIALSEENAVTLKARLARMNQEGDLVGSLLVDESTGIISSSGDVPGRDVESLGALLACNFTAAQELSHTLSARGFSAIMQRGSRWLVRAARVDARRFLVLVSAKGADRRKMRDAVNYFKTPLADLLAQVDAMSANRLNRFSEMFSSVSQLAVRDLAGA